MTKQDLIDEILDRIDDLNYEARRNYFHFIVSGEYFYYFHKIDGVKHLVKKAKCSKWRLRSLLWKLNETKIIFI